MKVLLINPPPYNHAGNSRFLEKTPIQTYTMPLGLGYIASYLEKHGYEVSILDAYAKKLSYEEIEGSIREMRPDIIGITCLSDQRAAWFRLIDVIRKADSTIKIVLGGAHPSLLTEQVLMHFRPDAVVLGEGEETMLELIEAWENKRDLDAVKGIAYMKDGKVIITLPRERIKALDDLPFPAYHLVNQSDYQGWEFLKMLYGMLGMEKQPKYASVSTSRGCVGDCGYCSSPLIWKRRWTHRSAENIADEMEKLNKEYNVEFIIVTDDIFTINQTRVISLCEELRRRNLNLMWGFETAVQFVSQELLHHAKKAGCCCILFGVESGSNTVLSNISKKINEEDVLKAFRMTKEAGILTGAFLMVGNPGESERSISETIHLLRKIEPDIILPQVTMITPSTKIYSLAKEKGFIDEGYWLTDLPFPYYTCERDLQTLLRWYRKLFYYKRSNIGILLRTMRDYIELHTGIRISRKGITKVEIPPD
jgi:anaerobic magnesium-protoporphyrin IX monomethyl ester cyclase